MESSEKAQQTLELWTGGQESPDGHTPTDTPKPKPNLRPTFLLVSAVVLVTAAATAGITYAAIDNVWMPDVTGTFYSESEHQTALEQAWEGAHEDGYSEGHAAGWSAGKLSGFAEGQDTGQEAGYREGRADGYMDGYYEGYGEGYGEGWADGCFALFDGLGTDRVGDWWDYYYSPSYASYYNTNACD
jgi:hypothetical protein